MADRNCDDNYPNRRRPLKLPFDTTDLYDFGFANIIPGNFSRDYSSSDPPQAPHLTVMAGSSKIKKSSNQSAQVAVEKIHEDTINFSLLQSMELNLPQEIGNGQELILRNDTSFGKPTKVTDQSDTETEDSYTSFTYPEPDQPPPSPIPTKNSGLLEKSTILRNDVESSHDFIRLDSHSNIPQNVLESGRTGIINTICKKNENFEFDQVSSHNIGVISTEKMLSSLSRNSLPTEKNAEILNWMSPDKTISMGNHSTTTNTMKKVSSHSQDIASVTVVNSDDNYLKSMTKLPSGVTVNFIRNSNHGSNFVSVSYVHKESSHRLMDLPAFNNVAIDYGMKAPMTPSQSNRFPHKPSHTSVSKYSVMEQQISSIEAKITEGTSFSDCSIAATKDSVESSTNLAELADILDSKQPAGFSKAESIATQVTGKSSRMKRSNKTLVTLSPPYDTMTNYMVDILSKVDKKIDRLVDNHLVKLGRDARRPSVIAKKKATKQNSKLNTVSKGKVLQNLTEAYKTSKTSSRIGPTRKVNSMQNKLGSAQVSDTKTHKQFNGKDSPLSITHSQPSKTQRNFVKENILKYSSNQVPLTPNVILNNARKYVHANDTVLTELLGNNFRKPRHGKSLPTTYINDEDIIREAVRSELAALLEFAPQIKPTNKLKSMQTSKADNDVEKPTTAINTVQKGNYINKNLPSTSKGYPPNQWQSYYY